MSTRLRRNPNYKRNDDVDKSVTIEGEKYNTFSEHHVNYNR